MEPPTELNLLDLLGWNGSSVPTPCEASIPAEIKML